MKRIDLQMTLSILFIIIVVLQIYFLIVNPDMVIDFYKILEHKELGADRNTRLKYLWLGSIGALLFFIILLLKNIK